MNWVDLLIVIIFGLYVWDGYRRGFLRLAGELIGLVVAFAFALKFYGSLNNILVINFSISELYTKPISFLSIWFVTQGIFFLVGRYLSYYTPTSIKDSPANHFGGLIPAAFKGIIFISVLLILFMITPINATLKNSVASSFIGERLITKTANIESQIENVFSGGNKTVSLISTVKPEENSELNFSTTDIKIDEPAEWKMLEMLNNERIDQGLQPLKQDILIRNVARSQSRDMLIRGYFSHNSPNGQDLKDRLIAAHASFSAAAENIALAPTINLAHIGLMNSPNHKKNILDPTFTKVGIGVVDAGSYGIMVTQDFAK